MKELKRLYAESEKGVHGEIYTVSMKSSFYISHHEEFGFIKVPISINETIVDDWVINTKPFNLVDVSDRFWEIVSDESSTNPVYTEKEIIKNQLEKAELKNNHLREVIEGLRVFLNEERMKVSRLNKRRFKWRWLYKY